MKVTLKRNWNAPGDQLFFVRNNPVEVDDDLLPYLPSDAVIVGQSRNETRKAVLIERRKQKLDLPTAELPQIALTSDEDLLAEVDGKKQANPGGTGNEKPPAPVDRATLEANLKTAQANYDAAQIDLADADSEPEKGVAKANLALAQKGMDEAEGALKSFDADAAAAKTAKPAPTKK